MAKISIDNGCTYCTPKDALKAISIDHMAHYMDPDTRETVHAELAPCTPLEFLERYLAISENDLIIG